MKKIKEITQKQFDWLIANCHIWGKAFCGGWIEDGISEYPYIHEKYLKGPVILGTYSRSVAISFNDFISQVGNPVEMVKEGKLVIENDNKDAAITVVNHCFPSNPSPKGTPGYYKAMEDGGWTGGEPLSLPSIKATELLEFINMGKPKEFTLPKYWHVVVDKDNIETLSKWRFEERYPINRLKIGVVVGLYKNGNKEWSSSATESFGQEITYQQFLDHVLKDRTQHIFVDGRDPRPYMVEGEYYKATHCTDPFIRLCKWKSGHTWGEKNFSKHDDLASENFWNISKPTQAEIDHLDKCIEAGKYVEIESIKEWSKGTYIVMLEDKIEGRMTNNYFTKGCIYPITRGSKECPYVLNDKQVEVNFIITHAGDSVKWFATKQEAQSFIDSKREIEKIARFGVAYGATNVSLQAALDSNTITFEENTAYHAETEEEAKMLLAEAHKQGYKWRNKKSYLGSFCWVDYEGNTCYNIINGTFFNKGGYYGNNDFKGKIVTVKELFNLNTKTNKDGSKESTSSKVNATLETNSRTEGGKEIKARTISSRNLCQRGSVTSSNSITSSRRSSSRIRAESGNHFIKSR